MHEVSLLNSTTLWYSVAAAIFVVLFFVAARRPILALIDAEIAKVFADLKEARRLNDEARATLEEYKQKQAAAAQEAEDIIKKARFDAERLREEAQKDIQKMVARHEQVALSRIRMAQEDSIAEVRAYVIEQALTEASGKLKKMAAGADGDALTNLIINDLPKLKAKNN